MKRILNTIVLTMAVNFAAAAGGIGWLASSGHLTKPRMAEIRRVLFPPPATQPSMPAAQPTTAAPTDAASQLSRFVARAAGRRSTDGDPTDRPVALQQVQDVTAADLDERRRGLLDLQQQVALAQGQLTRDREAVARDRQALAAERDKDAAAGADKGFQDSLALYRTLPPRQVKAIFATLPDDAVQRYLQAMDARQAAKVMKEYKSPPDVERLQRVLERIRQAPAAPTQPAADATAAAGR